MKIYIKTAQPSGEEEVITLNVQASDTITAIKAQIQSLEDIEAHNQTLAFQGQQLENIHQLSHYFISDGATLQLFSRWNMQIVVKTLTEKYIYFKVEASDKIETIKAMIQVKEGLLPAEQKLICAGRELHDGYTLADYNIQSGFTLYIALNKIQKMYYIQIDIQSTGKIITLRVYPTDTVAKVKMMINDNECIPPNQQILIFNGKILQDDKSLLSDHNIFYDSKLYLHVCAAMSTKLSSSTLQLVMSLNREVLCNQKHHRNRQDHHYQLLYNQVKLGQYKEKLLFKKVEELETHLTHLKLELCDEKEHTRKLNEDLNSEKENSQLLQQNLQLVQQNYQLIQQKNEHLENTVISGLQAQLDRLEDTVQRLQATAQQEMQFSNNVLLERLRGLEGRVERLQTITTSQDELLANNNTVIERIKGLEDTVERLWAISRDEVLLSDKILGTGGWGYVTEATYRGRRVAAKCLHEAIVSHHNQELFAKEMKISARCRHQNLVDFIGAVPDHPAIIVIELMDCTLRFALANRRVTPNHIYPISMDVSRGLLYLHSIQPHPLIHQDVSAPNVLLKAAGNGWVAKLSDLGSAQFANLAQSLAPGCFLYAAPEVRQRDSALQQTVKIDVYSFGVLLIEMLTREMPSGNIEALVRSLQSRWPHFVPLITSCTVTDPNQRPSMRQVIDQLDTITN